MEQRSTKHSARLDDELTADPADDGETDVDTIIELAMAPLPGALGEGERRRRSELAIALHPKAFPAERDALIRVAEGAHASDWILDLLAQLPIDTRFDTVQDVWDASGGSHEHRVAPGFARPPDGVDDASPGSSGGTAASAIDQTPAAPGTVDIVLGVVGYGVDLGVAAAHAVIAMGRRALRLRPRRPRRGPSDR